MKHWHTLFLITVTCFLACKQTSRIPSENYAAIKEFVSTAKIDDKDILYFYTAKPRLPLPNVYCFDSNGVQVKTPPNCFQYVKEYIELLNDSIMPVETGGQRMNHFLDSMKIVDVYDKVLEPVSFKGYDYYLFLDYLAIPDQGLRETLYGAKEASKKSKKRKIKLFLVHALSNKNVEQIKADNDSVSQH